MVRWLKTTYGPSSQSVRSEQSDTTVRWSDWLGHWRCEHIWVVHNLTSDYEHESLEKDNNAMNGIE